MEHGTAPAHPSEAGLSVAVEGMVRWMLDPQNFGVDLSIEIPSGLTEDLKKILVFESVRERLVNAAKHSKARSAREIL